MLGQHTPGPWEIDTYAKRDGRLFVQAERNGAYVALCDGISATIGSREELLANARLIAAAPELLTALVGLIKSDDQLREISLKHSRGSDLVYYANEHYLMAKSAARAAIARAIGTPTAQGTAAAVAEALGRSPTEPGTARLAADLGE